MNDDYLWDKSGQPDPQIQQLEEILGTLRYQPRPLEIPHDLRTPGRRTYFPLIAIAATVLVALLAAGLWLKARRAAESPQQQATVRVAPEVENKSPAPKATKENFAPAGQASPRNVAVAANNRRRNRSSATALTARQREEALAAKEQVMLALRLASEKLNLAHRKTQSTTPANQIKNQHRVG
jgi:FtsZ-interacting cell division protein ZipA